MEAELDATIERNAGEIERLKEEQKREDLMLRLKAKREKLKAQELELEELQQGKGEEPDRGQAQPGD